MNDLALAVQSLINALPSCCECGAPATRIGDDGDPDLKLCDTCRPDQMLWNESCTWAEPLRELMWLLSPADN